MACFSIILLLKLCFNQYLYSSTMDSSKKNHQSVKNWACYYGDNPELLKKLENYNLVIMEPDIDNFTPPEKTKTTYIGYVSLGEAERFRWYWYHIEGKKFILWENKNWKDDYIIDIRSLEWQNLLVEKIIPKILKKGYQGLFFDTIDTPIYLEEKDPEKYRGSVEALADLIYRIRKKYPKITLISNNGLRAIEHFGAHIDIFLIEGLNTTYDFKRKKYKTADIDWRNHRLSLIRNNRDLIKGKPVIVIDYLLQKQDNLRNISLIICKEHGLIPYHTTVDLHSLFPSPNK
ncbi:MAG: endo alpha-1,4 polygalactosaminidase [Chitinispirillia bacterium]